MSDSSSNSAALIGSDCLFQLRLFWPVRFLLTTH